MHIWETDWDTIYRVPYSSPVASFSQLDAADEIRRASDNNFVAGSRELASSHQGPSLNYTSDVWGGAAT